jgi:hypothetical protein
MKDRLHGKITLCLSAFRLLTVFVLALNVNCAERSWGMSKAEVEGAVLAGQPGDYMIRYQKRTNLYVVTVRDHRDVCGNVGIFIEQTHDKRGA